MASFASSVKKELTEVAVAVDEARAELIALVRMNGVLSFSKPHVSLEIATENAAIARRIYTSLKRAYLITPEILVRRKMKLKKNNVYVVRITRQVQPLLDDMGIQAFGLLDEAVIDAIKQDERLMRAYIRGAFMASGSVNNPETSSYHLEIYSLQEENNDALQSMLQLLGFDVRTTKRRRGYVLYLKDADRIADFLALIGANRSILKFENVRVTRDMRNSVNRRVNCENANLNKTVNAAVRQIENIEFVQRTVGLGALSDKLREMAETRLEYPDLSLKELGEMIPSGPVSKSGVNHRLRKINAYADSLREKADGHV